LSPPRTPQRKSSTPASPPKGGEEIQAARKTVDDYVKKLLALRRQLDAEILKLNRQTMTPQFEKRTRDDLARWARKEAREKILRTERISDDEFRIETSGEGLGQLRYTLRRAPNGLALDRVERKCEFCFGKGQCPHCDGKGCKDCSKTMLCFVCEGRIWEEYARCP
jgi:hypothetical protein